MVSEYYISLAVKEKKYFKNQLSCPLHSMPTATACSLFSFIEKCLGRVVREGRLKIWKKRKVELPGLQVPDGTWL